MLAWIATIVLTVAVLGGAFLARRHARGSPVSLAFGLGHAATAVTGVVLLGIAVFTTPQALAINAALLLFAIAFLGGAFLLLFRMQHETPPGFMIALHAVTALIALALVWIGLLLG